MLFNCAPHGGTASGTTHRKLVKRGNKSLAVDLHCHVHTPAADEIARKSDKQADVTARYGDPRTIERQKQLRIELDRKLTSVEQRLADMDRMGVDVQAISTSPMQYYYGLDIDLGRQASRTVNQRLAEIVASHPDRFVGLGTVPLQAPALAVAELEYCMTTLGFRGLEIGTNVGGYMGHYPARMDHAYKVRPECHDHITRPPSYYMKKIYYDTMVFSHEQLEHLVNLWGAGHVVIGTDYPYDMGYYKPVDFVNKSKALTRAQKAAIIGGNAAKLLGLKQGKR